MLSRRLAPASRAVCVAEVVRSLQLPARDDGPARVAREEARAARRWLVGKRPEAHIAGIPGFEPLEARTRRLRERLDAEADGLRAAWTLAGHGLCDRHTSLDSPRGRWGFAYPSTQFDAARIAGRQIGRAHV